MGNGKGVVELVWSDEYYDQAASLVDFLLGGGTCVKWCDGQRLAYIKRCLRDMATMDAGEEFWDYGERSVKLAVPCDVERDVYRLMSDAPGCGFRFGDASVLYSLSLLDEAGTRYMVEKSNAAHAKFERDKYRMKRRARENDAAACLDRYLHDCHGAGVTATIDGYARACGPRRIGRKVWRKYMA